MSSYPDGVYYGMGDFGEYGCEDATFTIENGRLKSIKLRKLGFDKKEVDYSEWNGRDGTPDLDFARQEMENKMIKAQSFDVPNVLGAALSCQNWKVAIGRAVRINTE